MAASASLMLEHDIGEARGRWQAWRTSRAASLAAPDSWLGLIGLFWLEEGTNAVGNDPAASVVLPEGPAEFGHLHCKGATVLWQAAGKAKVLLKTDADGEPSLIEIGALAFFVIERDGRLAVRLRDRTWAEKKSFEGIDYFAYEPAWVIDAEWRPLDPPQTMEVLNVSGELTAVQVEWQAIFRVGDKDVGLLPMSHSEEGAFFVFRDATSGRQTYGAGRFLNTKASVDGRIVLDFNYAYSPPCAFTPFATCPLPPPENWLPFKIEAGEQKLGH